MTVECSGDIIVWVGMVTCMPDIRNEKGTIMNRLPSTKLETMATSKYGQRDVLMMSNISRPSSSYSYNISFHHLYHITMVTCSWFVLKVRETFENIRSLDNDFTLSSTSCSLLTG